MYTFSYIGMRETPLGPEIFRDIMHNTRYYDKSVHLSDKPVFCLYRLTVVVSTILKNIKFNVVK